MKPEIRIFLNKLDSAIDLVMKKKDSSAHVDKELDKLIDILEKYKESVGLGRLPLPSKDRSLKGAILGLRKGVGEWSEDDELLDCMRDLDLYYRDNL